MADVTFLHARIGDDERDMRFTGRDAWTLDHLINAGERGVTPLDRPAPRWAHYVFRLRRQGVPIETIHEAHAGPYAGTHARYVLRTPAVVIERRAA